MDGQSSCKMFRFLFLAISLRSYLCGSFSHLTHCVVSKELDSCNIGTTSKDALRKAVQKLKKFVDDKDKKLKQERQKKCLAKASEIAEKEKDSHFVVLQLDEAMANSKTLNEVLKSFKKIAPKLPVMLLR